MKFKWVNREKFINSYKPDDLQHDLQLLNSVYEYAEIAKKTTINLYENGIEKILVRPKFYECLISECEKVFPNFDKSKGLTYFKIPVEVDENLMTDYKILYKTIR